MFDLEERKVKSKNFKELVNCILENSVCNSSFDDARFEWDYVYSYDTENEEWRTCICTHFPIKEICVIHNRKNGRELELGNCCIKLFMPFEARVASSLTRKSLSQDLIMFAFQRKVIREKDKDFLLDVRLKRKLSIKQMAYQSSLKRMIFFAFLKHRNRPVSSSKDDEQ